MMRASFLELKESCEQVQRASGPSAVFLLPVLIVSLVGSAWSTTNTYPRYTFGSPCISTRLSGLVSSRWFKTLPQHTRGPMGPNPLGRTNRDSAVIVVAEY